MGRTERVSYSCDKCGKTLKTCNNTMAIVTELSDKFASYWSRLRVQIIYAHGMHNDRDEKEAELCQTCAIDLLTDALKRIRKGERVTSGYEDINQSAWE